MCKKALKVAGFIAIFNATIAIPLFLLSSSIEAGPIGTNEKIQLILLNVVSVGIVIYLLLTLRRFLRTKFGFEGIDRPVKFLVCGNILYLIIASVVADGSFDNQISETITLAFMSLMGIGQIWFAQALRKLNNNLNKLLRPYIFLNFATGVALASIIFAPLILILSPISDIMLSTIFWQAAKSISEPVLEMPQR